MDIIKILQEELGIRRGQVETTIKLIDEGNTIPFIARYRKEMTGSLDDEPFHYGMAARMFNALYKADVNIRMISTSEIRVTVLVNQEDMVKAMNAAHEEFEM